MEKCTSDEAADCVAVLIIFVIHNDHILRFKRERTQSQTAAARADFSRALTVLYKSDCVTK